MISRSLFLLKVQGQESWSLRDTIVPSPLW
jgi:hypothetical protein